MKKILLFSVLLAVLGVSTGCVLFRNPMKNLANANAKIEKTENKIDVNTDKIIEQGRKYVYATKISLELDPSTNKLHELASDFNEKALITLGNPSMEAIVVLREMVDNLISTNKSLVAQGEVKLKELDKTIIKLQTEKTGLETLLTEAQNKYEKVAKENSGLAQNWARIMKIFWGVIYLIVGTFILRLISAILPPPYSSISFLFSIPISLITKVLHGFAPEAKEMAGVVSKEYKDATQQLVATLQNLKDLHPEIHADISKSVANNIDSNLVPIVNKAKTDLNMIS